MKSQLHLTPPLHELAVCEWVLRQVLAVAVLRNVQHVGQITLYIEPIAELEFDLVRLAFPIVAAGTRCDSATLEIAPALVEVCRVCGATSNVRPNRLSCAGCVTWRVDLDKRRQGSVGLRRTVSLSIGMERLMGSDRPSSHVWSGAISHVLTEPVVAVVMGVSGSGKTTVAVLLAAALGCQFQDGDDLHAAANVEKMASGMPLTDRDRLPWRQTIARKSIAGGRKANLAC